MNSTHPLSFTEIPSLSVLVATFPGLRAIFFDMDGTLFNTESHHEKAFLRIGHDHKIRPPFSPETVHELLMGKADYLVFDIVRTWENFPTHWTVDDFVATKNQNLLKILESVDPATFFAPELKILLNTARASGMYLGLVTSSEKVITKRLLEMAGLGDFFDLILTRDDCPQHKPDPWPYRKAQELARLAPHETLIFEDSDVGLRAAISSGSHVIKVEWY